MNAGNINKSSPKSELYRHVESLSATINDLNKAYEKLQYKNNYLVAITGNVSHELRTTLNVIMSSVQLLMSKADKVVTPGNCDMVKKQLRIIKQNCYRQLKLVNNIIDSARLEAGFYEVTFENYDIVKITEQITLSVSEYIKSKSISLFFDSDIQEKIIACDPDKIERIMLNLLSNSVKFTDEGGSICVRVSGKGENVVISVKDNGKGIPEYALDDVFKPFMQIDNPLARENTGSGIGLTLVKRLVELHGGRIHAESEYGKGSNFIMELPNRTAEFDSASKKEVILQSKVQKMELEFSDIYDID